MASGQMRQTLSAQAAGTKLQGRGMTSASRSLDLLRLNIQTIINKEIDAVLKKYLDKFFTPAIENIRNNLGEHSITEDSIKMVCRQILEDAKVQYCSTSQSRGSSPLSDLEAGNLGECRLGYNVSGNPMLLYQNKKKESDPDSESNQSVTKLRRKASRHNGSALPGVPTPLKVMKVENVRREGPKWDPNRIVKSTLFIMGARANKVLGFGQTRGRLYTKHPELLKYSGDAEDKEWLARNNLIPPTGGIAYLLILEDVKELAESEEYRHNPNVLLNDLIGFKAPEFMLKKIRAFIAQARSNNNVTFIYSNEINQSASGRNFIAEYEPFVATPSAAVLESDPNASCDYLELMDVSNNLLAPARPNEFFSWGTPDQIYDDVVHPQGNKSNQPPSFSESNHGSVNTYSSLTSFLVTSHESNNSRLTSQIK